MAEICPVCGQRIRIRIENRKWGKKYTVIDGIDSKEMRLDKLASTLKHKCACGGTAKNNQILLMGDHRDTVLKMLVSLGFPEANIEVQ